MAREWHSVPAVSTASYPRRRFSGKQADLILVDLTPLTLSPVLTTLVRNIIPNLVDTAGGHEIETVIVAGRIIVQDGHALTATESAIRTAGAGETDRA